MKKLGKLIAKNFVVIAGFYLFAMAACGTGLVINNAPTSNASSGGEPAPIANPTASITLWSIMAALTVVIIAAAIIFLITRKQKTKESQS